MTAAADGMNRKGRGAFLIAEGLRICVPLIRLGTAIESPTSLSEPARTGWLGVVAGVSVMTPTVELFGVDIGGEITITTSLVHIWWLVLGAVLLVARGPGGRDRGGLTHSEGMTQ